MLDAGNDAWKYGIDPDTGKARVVPKVGSALPQAQGDYTMPDVSYQGPTTRLSQPGQESRPSPSPQAGGQQAPQADKPQVQQEQEPEYDDYQRLQYGKTKLRQGHDPMFDEYEYLLGKVRQNPTDLEARQRLDVLRQKIDQAISYDVNRTGVEVPKSPMQKEAERQRKVKQAYARVTQGDFSAIQDIPKEQRSEAIRIGKMSLDRKRKQIDEYKQQAEALEWVETQAQYDPTVNADTESGQRLRDALTDVHRKMKTGDITPEEAKEQSEQLIESYKPYIEQEQEQAEEVAAEQRNTEAINNRFDAVADLAEQRGLSREQIGQIRGLQERATNEPANADEYYAMAEDVLEQGEPEPAIEVSDEELMGEGRRIVMVEEEDKKAVRRPEYGELTEEEKEAYGEDWKGQEETPYVTRWKNKYSPQERSANPEETRMDAYGEVLAEKFQRFYSMYAGVKDIGEIITAFEIALNEDEELAQAWNAIKGTGVLKPIDDKSAKDIAAIAVAKAKEKYPDNVDAQRRYAKELAKQNKFLLEQGYDPRTQESSQ